MGPAWTLMRSISGYHRTDHAWEATLSVADRTALAAHREARPRTAARILALLDLYCGDPALEWRLHSLLAAALEEHHAPVQQELDNRRYATGPLSAAARRTFRKAEERRGSIRPGASTSDREEVFGGLSRMTDNEGVDGGGGGAD